MSMNTLYLECYSGISGDMTVASLIDLGVDPDQLLASLNTLHLEGYSIEISRVLKAGIDACDFNVILDKDHENHDHDMEYLHGSHDHDHHHHEHHHHEHHHHEHRNLESIQSIINHSGLTERAKELALKIFQVIAEAEAKAHRKSLDEVHFHEVGAIDSIVDIAAIAICIDALNIDQVIVSELYEGQGTVRCQHGILPIPVPAVSNIISSYDLPIHIMDIQGEFVTPTGAAIVAALRTGSQLPKHFRILKTGIGAGKRNYEKASILRAMLIEDLDAHKTETAETIWKIETNLDDCTGETLAFALEQLFEAGAQDVYTSPIYMKKNRPAVMLSILCKESLIETMEDIVFTHTTTIGIRKYPVERTVLSREIRCISTPFGPAQVKYSTWKGCVYAYPENDSVAELAKKHHLSFSEMYHHVKSIALKEV